MNELERQDILRGKLMAELLAKGVRRQEISAEIFDDGLEDFDALFLDMVAWLKAEGFVRCSGVFPGSNNETCASDIVPTSRGMSLLDQKVDGEKTGRDIVNASMEGDHPSWSKFGALIGGFVGGFVQSAQ